MKAEDFSAWLSAIAGLSAEQRGEALQALAARGEKEGSRGGGLGAEACEERRPARSSGGRAWNDQP